MKLFTIGPVMMHERTFKVKQKQITHFRTKEFSDITYRCADSLKKMIGTSNTSKVFFMTCSGTGAMEASVINALEVTDKALVIDGGVYGDRFEKICTAYKIPNDSIKLKVHEELTERHFENFEDKGYTALLVNLHETSVGQLYDINILSKFAKRNNLLLIVDAISTFVCDEYYMDKWGIDITIISSQKGLAIDPGLGIVITNKKTYEERILNTYVTSLYFDLKAYASYMEKGQTPFTPAVEIMYELDDMLIYIKEKGIKNIIKENKEKAEVFREAIKDLPITYPKTKMSNALTPLYFNKGVDAYKIYRNLKKRGMLVNFDTSDIDSRLIRVSHIGNTSIEDMSQIVKEIKEIIK